MPHSDARPIRRAPAGARLLLGELLLAAGALLLAAGLPALADDRDLLRQQSANPYFFVLLDTSGSMNERPGTGSTTPIASADDPESKLYQAKQSLYNALLRYPDVQYGFATFNQDSITLPRKHWVYKAAASPGWTVPAYPVNNTSYVFGREDDTESEIQANQDDVGSCGSPLALPSTANSERIAFSPKTGTSGTLTSTFWLRESSQTYRMDTSISSGTFGSSTIQVRVRRRRVSSCNSGTFDQDTTSTITFNLVTDSLEHQTDWVDDVPQPSGTCNGWEPNNDTGSDRYKFPTTPSLLFPLNRKFDRGDLLPLDWLTSNRDEIQRRLAPNLRLPGQTVPDFRVARYFTNTAVSGTLPIKDVGVIPFIAGGLTPLGNSMSSFRTWYAGCSSGTCTAGSGWKDVAAANDPNWACRKKYLLVLTDGEDTCDGGGTTGPACAGAKVLFDTFGITTFVIAFGQVGVSGNVLACMASNGSGGTIPPFNPQDQNALDNALNSIFDRVVEEARSFASAAVPSVQAEVADKIYLSSFKPLNSTSFTTPPASSQGAGAVWDGHLDAFLKPLPIRDGLPARDLDCAMNSLESGCHLWDAGKEMLGQSPTQAEVNQTPPLLKLGAFANQRRVFYSKQAIGSTIPVGRRLFEPAPTLAEQQDLWEGMGISVADTANTALVTAANNEVRDIIKYTLQQKVATVETTNDTKFVLGDIFHSNPVLVGEPNRFRYFAADLRSDGRTCAAGNPGYRCFAEKHRLRRKMLAVGSNDGQLHVFDIGIFEGSLNAGGQVTGSFNNGTGKEILSYIPRPVLPTVRDLKKSTKQDWGVDGTPQVDDVFIDPSHTGMPTVNQREWRTVLIGGLREGGQAYYALDLTQPDVLDTGNIPDPINTYVPSCWNGGGSCGTLPFGAVLWNFVDVTDEDPVGSPGRGFPDLGDTWSVPNTGRIKLTDPTKPLTDPARLIDRYVAIFGGGMDPERLNRRGNWLYIVDIETGKMIYKRRLEGSAPSEPAAVDTNQDGYIDTVYIGTTGGFLYKVDMSTAANLETVSGQPKITDLAWEPFKIFDTVQEGTGRRGPLYFPPSVIFVTKLGRYALGFGTGDRERLWNEDGTPGRFYLILDEPFTRAQFLSGVLPRDERDYLRLDVDSAIRSGTDFLINPDPGFDAGWVMRLGVDERVITKSFALSGILVFSSFNPTTPPPVGGLCARAGTSNIFVVFTNNANPVLKDADGILVRGSEKPSFVTNPFVETSSTKNPARTPCDPADPACNTVAVCRGQEDVVNTLKALFPANCKFANFTQNIQTIQADTKLVCIAPVPVCVVEKNWKEF